MIKNTISKEHPSSIHPRVKIGQFYIDSLQLRYYHSQQSRIGS